MVSDYADLTHQTGVGQLKRSVSSLSHREYDSFMPGQILETTGKIAGIGGLAIGVFVILFREFIRKNIFPVMASGVTSISEGSNSSGAYSSGPSGISVGPPALS